MNDILVVAPAFASSSPTRHATDARKTPRRGLAMTLALLMSAAGGCGSVPVPPADLSVARFASIPAVQKHPIAIVVNVDRNAVARRAYGSGSLNYRLPYVLGDVERRYAQAVARAAFAAADFDAAPVLGSAELRLTSFTHVLVPHSTGTLPDVTDEVTAKWTLHDGSGAPVAQFVFVGVQTGATRGGFMGAQIERGQARAVLAVHDLYRKTVEGFAAAPEIREAIER